MRRVLVGRVAVDSATLVITDPSNLDREWVKASDREPYALNCLGRDVQVLIGALRDVQATGDVVPMAGGRWYRVFPSDSHTALDVLAEAKRLQAAHGWVGALIPISHDSLETVQEAVRERIGGEIAFSHGNPGFMAAVSLGGDGIYEVYAEVEDTAEGALVKSITISEASA